MKYNKDNKHYAEIRDLIIRLLRKEILPKDIHKRYTPRESGGKGYDLLGYITLCPECVFVEWDVVYSDLMCYALNLRAKYSIIYQGHCRGCVDALPIYGGGYSTHNYGSLDNYYVSKLGVGDIATVPEDVSIFDDHTNTTVLIPAGTIIQCAWLHRSLGSASSPSYYNFCFDILYGDQQNV